MQKLTIIDGNNWFRRIVETCPAPLRRAFSELNSTPSAVIIVWDGKNSLSKRRALYPEYKQRKNKPGDNLFDQQDMFKKLVQLSKVTSIEVPGYEADDVIADLINNRPDGVSLSDIVIDSNDMDFVQLGVTLTRKDYPMNPNDIKLYKTLVGDPSDNIKGVPNFGKSAWGKLSEQDKDTLRSAFIVSDKVKIREVLSGKASIAQWLALDENIDKLFIYWKVISFIPVPKEEIEKNTIVGLNRSDLAHGAMKNLMW